MHRMIMILIVACGLQGCEVSSWGQDPWTDRDSALQTWVTVAYAIDAAQTADIQYDPRLEEGGLIAHNVLGRQPSTSDTWQYFATVAFSSYVLAYYMPAKWRPWFQGGQLAGESYSIYNNCRNGVGCSNSDKGTL